MQKLSELVKDEIPRGMRISLEAGIAFEREAVRLWTRLAQAGS